MKRYLINNEVYKGIEMPNQSNYNDYDLTMYYLDLREWRQSLVKLDCDESELNNIKSYVFIYFENQTEPIDVTLITSVKESSREITKSGEIINYKVYFKEVKSDDEVKYTLEEIIFGVRKMLKSENILFHYVREELPRFLEESKKELFKAKK
jgi:hypothetical protein